MLIALTYRFLIDVFLLPHNSTCRLDPSDHELFFLLNCGQVFFIGIDHFEVLFDYIRIFDAVL